MIGNRGIVAFLLLLALDACSSGTPVVTRSTPAATPAPSPSLLKLPPWPNGFYRTKVITRNDILRIDSQATGVLSEVGHRQTLRLFNGHWGAGIYYLSDGNVVFEFHTEAIGYKILMEWKLKGRCLYLTVLSNNTGDASALQGDRHTFQAAPFCRHG